MNFIKKWRQKRCEHEWTRIPVFRIYDGWFVQCYTCERCGMYVDGNKKELIRQRSENDATAKTRR